MSNVIIVVVFFRISFVVYIFRVFENVVVSIFRFGIDAWRGGWQAGRLPGGVAAEVGHGWLVGFFNDFGTHAPKPYFGGKGCGGQGTEYCRTMVGRFLKNSIAQRWEFTVPTPHGVTGQRRCFRNTNGIQRVQRTIALVVACVEGLSDPDTYFISGPFFQLWKIS